MKSSRLSLAALMGAQAQVTFNDNAAKLMLVALAQFPGVLPGWDSNFIRALLGALLVAPFILFSPLAGWINDRFAKSAVLNRALGLQFGVMLALIASLWFHWMWGAILCFVGLAVQATIFSPAKRGILREIVGPDQLSKAVGVMEMLSVGTILAGGFGGGWMFDHWTGTRGRDPWQGALITTLVLTALSGGSWLVFQLVQKTKPQSNEPFSFALFYRHGSQVAELWRERILLRATVGIMFFYGLGGYVYLLFIQMGADIHEGGVGSATTTGILLLLLGGGTIIGNLAAGLFSKRGVELGLIPLGGVVLLAALAAAGTIAHVSPAFDAWLVVAGFGSGLFLVPLYAFIQETAGDHRRGRVLAAVGLLDSAAGFAANGLFFLLASENTLHLSPRTQFAALCIVTFLMLGYALWHLPYQTVCTLMRLGGRVFYRVRSIGHRNIPSGGALVICNHLSYIDAVVLQIASPRPMRFIAFAGFARSPALRFLFRALGVIPIAPGKPTKGIRIAAEAIRKGELVCVFPEGAISRTGQLMELKRGFGLIAELAGAPVVPAVIDGLWGSIYSFAGNKYLWKSPRLMPTPVCVVFGESIPPHQADRDTARRALLDLGERAFQERPVLKRNLAHEAIRALAKRPGHVELVDRTAERREVTAAQLLALAATLSRRIRATVPEKRVGIVLPPGAGAHIANLAVACAGKVPVNLNFTAGRAAVEASLALGEIQTVITAEAVRAKLPQFPFPEKTLDLKKEIEAAGGKRVLLPWVLAAYLLPNQWVADLVGVPRRGDSEEAVLLFTSGSSGEPKGVTLSHRNLLANCAQISSLSILPASARVLGCLPVFHCFGFTVTIWYTLLRGCRVVTVPSPLDTRKIIDAIKEEKATVMVGAPTFIRPMLKKARREELQSLNLVVSGAEKLTPELHDAFRQQFGIEMLQGYGMTEATPVVSINQYDPPITTSTAEHQLGNRFGSVGRLLPGMAARIVDPDTGVILPLTATGMLWLKGPNVYSGYLRDAEKTAAALKDGWYVTGDLGRIDEDGFLFIEGRLSRFSKIGGEMVPHGTVEQRIVEVLGWEQGDGPTVVVTSVPDAAKGEALVVLTTRDLAAADLRARLLETGLPNLWIPKLVLRVESIPILGTGKTDLKACRVLALELAREPAGT
jgi:acyl-[acyl-carrier-protein]-phospholipid O-acyltransferase / long-chain-fatty-acid--[acyl-carrier-protein] ligase